MPTSKSNPFLLIFTILLLALTSCKEHDNRCCPFGIDATASRADSLLVEANRAVYDFQPPEVLDSIVAKYEALTAGNPAAEASRLYWRGTALFMQGEFEQGDSLRRLAYAMVDSAASSHDWRLYRMAIEQPSDFQNDIERYNRYNSDLSAFLADGDLASAASRAVMLSQMLGEAGLSQSALQNALLADSLYASADLPRMRLNNLINLSSARFAAGDTLGAVSTLDELRPQLSPDDVVMQAVLEYNLYGMTADTAALRRAWENVKDIDALARFRALIAASMVKKGMQFADSDVEVRIVGEGLDYDYLPAEQVEIDAALLRLATTGDDSRNVNEAALRFTASVDDYIARQAKAELTSSELANQIRSVVLKAKTDYLRRIFILVAAALIVAAFGVILFVSYRNRQRRSRIILQLEAEEQRRRQLSTALRLAAKTKEADLLAAEIENLTSTPSAAALSDDEFLGRLASLYPKVSRSARLLALHIRRGADTSEIARIMNIRKESVIQGRWRLRQQMGLDTTDDLEAVLHKIR